VCADETVQNLGGEQRQHGTWAPATAWSRRSGWARSDCGSSRHRPEQKAQPGAHPPGCGRSLLDQRHWQHAEIGEAAEKVARELGRVVVAGAREPDRIVPVAEIHTRRRGRGKSRTMPVRSSSQSMHQATRRASSLGRHGEATLHHRRGEGRRDQVMMDVDSRFLRHASSGPCCEGPITRHDRGSRVPRD